MSRAGRIRQNLDEKPTIILYKGWTKRTVYRTKRTDGIIKGQRDRHDYAGSEYRAKIYIMLQKQA
jgi:hypothetical protein